MTGAAVSSIKGTICVWEGIPIDGFFFDGAFGTYYRALTGCFAPCEMANLTDPARVFSIHRAYVDAGANAIKTNTFGLNPGTTDADVLENALKEGVRLAREAAGERANVFADVGPIAASDRDVAEDYLSLVQMFAHEGLTRFLFETMDAFEPLVPAIRWIREAISDAVIAVSFAASQDGYTGAGLHYRDLIDAARAEGADLVGLNCVSGPAHMLGLLRRLDLTRGDLLAMPNAGYPARVNGRLLYEDNPGYFAEKLKDMKRLGVKVLGGCCGTTPEHIRRAAACCVGQSALPAQAKTPERQASAPILSALAGRIARGNLAIVEVDPPVDADISHLMNAARRLRDAGADAITLADAPLARARADSLMMAAMTLRETGIDVVPHLTCRDRNRIAVRGAFLAAHAAGIRNALIVTGDPIPGAAHGPDESAADKGVFNFNSFSLIDFLRGMNLGPFAEAPFFILAAFNISATNFDAELRRAERKIGRGADAFITQSIFSKDGVANLKKASEALGKPVIAGIMPVAGYKNAVFLNNEVPGVSIPIAFVDSLQNQPRDVVTERSLAFSRELIKEAKPFCAGFCVMTPLKRVDLAEALLQTIKGGL